ncbi:MAG: glutathione S-transferase family protein [Alphaproteobacteria bacterium]
MGLLVDGNWQDTWYDTSDTGGRFVRKETAFHHWITKDGAPGPTGRGGFAADTGRYHLYISLACPWAHRTLIFRKLKQLESHISLSVVHWHMGSNGWEFVDGPGCACDRVNNSRYMYQIYTKSNPHYTGRVTVPVLWDKRTGVIVNNESSEIIRMFNSAFDGLTGDNQDFYPAELRREIDAINEIVYHKINNGVYKAGFATTQQAYTEAAKELFEALDMVEARLANQRYLVGARLTEADWRLFTTLVRFDPVYVGHFKCNLRRIVDYPNIDNYMRELYQMPGIAETVDLHHIKHHYYGSHKHVNPAGIVPLGPTLNYAAPHDRARLKAA